MCSASLSDYDDELFCTPPRDDDGLPELWGSTLEDGWEDVDPEDLPNAAASHRTDVPVKRTLDMSTASCTPMVSSAPPPGPSP